MRYECCCFVRVSKTENETEDCEICGNDEGLLYQFMKYVYAPFLMLKPVRIIVVCQMYCIMQLGTSLLFFNHIPDSSLSLFMHFSALCPFMVAFEAVAVILYLGLPTSLKLRATQGHLVMQRATL